MSEPVRVQVLRLAGTQDLPLPDYATPGSAGMDLRAAVDEDVVLEPGARVVIPAGIRLAVPTGYEAQVRPRSGLALRHGLLLPNAPGTIDADYRGEVQVILWNSGAEPFTVRRGDRIAQLVLARCERVAWDERESLDETARGEGGFGSTDRGRSSPGARLEER